MKVYVFGNKDSELDNKAFVVAKRLKKSFPKLEFVEVGLNSDLPFNPNEHVYILDAVEGIPEPVLIENDDLDKLVSKSSTSVHDFDLGFQLKYLKKLNKLGSVTIIGIPMKKPIDYLRIQSIFKKLVAQDMQGS
jgi:Ni,Fe-hydrogenase maturation factor